MKHLLHTIAALFLRLLPAKWARIACKNNPTANVTTNMTARQMLIDVSMIYQTDAKTGIQRVVRSMLSQLLKSPPEGYDIRPIYATRKNAYCYAETDFLMVAHRTNIQSSPPVKVRAGDIFLGLDLAAHLLPIHQAQLLEWKRKDVKLHVVVYDLLPLLNPDWFSSTAFKNFKRWTRWIAVYADSAICISGVVKDQLATLLNDKYQLAKNALPIRTIVLGADIRTSRPSTGLPSDITLMLQQIRSTPTVLMVGTLEPRKAYQQVLEAFEILWQLPNAPRLLIAGKPGWKTETLQAKLRSHPSKGKQFIWLEDASDELLEQLYAECRGVLAASLAEGFGLPVIEAAVLSKPVLARDIPVFREIDLPNIAYFKADTAYELANAITDWMNQPPSNAPTEAQKQGYSWEESARQLVQQLYSPMPATHTVKRLCATAPKQKAH
jgi:glycosyltransferase involved in cell wall biosynthesis